MLLLNAAMRAMRSEVAIFALLVRCERTNTAAAFYRYHQFTAPEANPFQLIAPLDTFRKLLTG